MFGLDKLMGQYSGFATASHMVAPARLVRGSSHTVDGQNSALPIIRNIP